jgi:hypothetical protein
MTPGALIDDDYSSEQLAPKKLAQAKGIRFDVRVLTNLPQDASELEVLLLAWTLLLYRNSLGNHVQYSWRYSEIGSSTNTTLEVNTSKLQWNAADSISTALGAIRGFLQNNIDPETTLSVDRHTFLLNDEFAPPGSFTPFKEGPIMDWVSVYSFTCNLCRWLTVFV